MDLFFKKLLNINWNYPTTIWFGNKRINDLDLACNQLNIKNPLVVTDPILEKMPMINKIIENLKQKGLNTNIFSNLKPNPVGSNVIDGVKFFNSNNCDGVVAIGGGSGLDSGKGIAFMASQDRPLWDFEDIGDYWKRANPDMIKPIIAVPTTAGTGSETGRAGVFINEEKAEKKIIFHPKMLPSIVILDPELTLNLPTGMDALTHNLEAFCSPHFHPMAEGIALEGLRIIKEYLPKVVNDGKNLTARGYMLVASSMGSTAFQKGLGAIHSLSHPISAIYDTHHGLTNAVFMPYVLIKNREIIEEKIILLSKYMGLKNYSFESFIKWILEIRSELDIPNTTKEINIDPNDFEKLSKMALADPSTASNPLKLNEEDFLKLYKDSYYGNL